MKRASHFRLRAVLLLLWCGAPLAAPQLPVACAQDEPESEREDDGRNRFWERFRKPSVFQRSHDSVVEPFAEVTVQAARSTVRVMVDGDQAALGTVVASRGLILTKASELGSGEDLVCELYDARRLEAEQVGISEEHDLALLRVPAEDLVAVEWAEEEVPVGAWVVTPGMDDLPESIGVVSTTPRRIPKSRALLGVRLGANPQNPKGGARVGLVFPNSGAQRAGVEEGDVIIGADDSTVRTPEDLIAHVSGMLPGDRVRLKLLRGDDEKTVTAELTDEEALSQSRVEVQNSLGGPISRRRAGFPRVVQHDSVLRPEQCGGPVVNLDGKVIGMNIARAGRVASYAIPSAEVIRLLPTMVSSMDTFRQQERQQQISDLEQSIEKWKETVAIWKMRLERAEADAAAENQSEDQVAKARKDAEKFAKLIEEANGKLKKLNDEVAALRSQQVTTTE